MQPMPVAKQTVLHTSSGDKVDEEYAADLRDKMKAPKASATKTIRNSQGDEITGDYALALRKKVRRQAELETMTIPGSTKEKTVAMPQHVQNHSSPYVKPRGSVAKNSNKKMMKSKAN